MFIVYFVVEVWQNENGLILMGKCLFFVCFFIMGGEYVFLNLIVIDIWDGIGVVFEMYF